MYGPHFTTEIKQSLKLALLPKVKQKLGNYDHVGGTKDLLGEVEEHFKHHSHASQKATFLLKQKQKPLEKDSFRSV